MAKMAKKNEGMTNAQKLGIGVGITTAVAAAAGAYFLYGSKDAAKNRKKVRSWALKARGDVLAALEKAEKMTEAEFKELVEKVGATYAKVENLSKAELSNFKKEMSENWQDLLKSGVAKAVTQAVVAKTVSTAAKKPAKKAAQKTTQKPAKKASSTTTAKKAPAKKTAAKKTT